MDIVRVTLKVEEILKHKHEFESNEYITLEVARMQQPDKFGPTHTAYVSVLKEVEENVETEIPKEVITEKPKKRRNAKKRKVIEKNN